MGDFHLVWLTRLAQSSAPPVSEDTLLPYADALEFQGASWGLDPGEIGLLLLHEEGQATFRHGIVHPDRDTTTQRLTGGEITETVPLWAALRDAQDIAYSCDGFQLFIAGYIRYSPDCMRCHDGKAGEVAGALVYSFTEIPDD